MSPRRYTIFIDDSRQEQPPANALGALLVPDDKLDEAEARWDAFRAWLFREYGLPVERELNASKLIRGAFKDFGIYRQQGTAAYRYALRALAGVDEVNVVACMWRGSQKFQSRAFQFLGERLEATMYHRLAFASVYCDEGENMLGLFRRLKEQSTVKAKGHAQGGTFADGSATKNIPWNHLESFEHVDSKHVWGVQAADFIAFACLRSEFPNPRLAEYALSKPWDYLKSAWLVAASESRDGIVRRPRRAQ